MIDEIAVTLPDYFSLPVLFIIGLFTGSLINTIAFRYPLGIGLFNPGPFCPRCNSPLATKDTVPVLGYLLLRGKCRHCQAAIHPRLPLVELATGLLFAAAHHAAGFSLPHGVAVLFFIAAMILVALIDLDHHIIPDAVSLTGLIVSLAAAPVLPHLHHAENAGEFALHHPILAHFFPGQRPYQHAVASALAGAATGLIFALAVYFLGTLLLKNLAAKNNVTSALGLGDVKLMTFIGAFLGGKNVLLAFGLAAILGAATGIVRKLHSGTSGGGAGLGALRRRWETGTSILPFGPLLAVGALVCLFMEDKVTRIVFGW